MNTYTCHFTYPWIDIIRVSLNSSFRKIKTPNGALYESLVVVRYKSAYRRMDSNIRFVLTKFWHWCFAWDLVTCAQAGKRV